MSSQLSTISRKTTSFSRGFYSKKDPHGPCLDRLPTPGPITAARLWFTCWFVYKGRVTVYCTDPIWVIRMNKEPELSSTRGPRGTTCNLIKGDSAA